MSAKSIDIIDDEADLSNLFREALEMNGFNVSAFTDSVEALEQVKENPKKFALIISDFRMPKVDGYELCTKILNINPHIKVILMSAYDNIPYDKSRMIYLSKPIPMAKLVKIVTEILGEDPKPVAKLKRKHNTVYNIKVTNTKSQDNCIPFGC